MPSHMAIANPSKALIAMVGMVCITVLMALEKIATEAATGMIAKKKGMPMPDVDTMTMADAGAWIEEADRV